MNESQLNTLLLNEPEFFWQRFKESQDFNELLKMAKVIYKDRATIPGDCKSKLNTILNQCIMEFINYNVDYEDKVLLIELSLNGKRDITNFKYIKSYKHLLYALRFGDVVPSLEGFINRLSIDILKNMNIKHFFEFRNKLLSKGCKLEDAIKLAFQVYNIFGYFKGKDLLDNKYGVADISHLKDLIKNVDLSDVTYQEKTPHVNETIINVLMAENYHVMRTPLERFLSNKIDKSELYFIDNLALILKKWDTIVREYIKRVKFSSLKIRLNLGTINKILQDLQEVKRNIKKNDSLRGAKKRRFLHIPDYQAKDEPLLNSDLFDYIEIPNKYILNPENKYDRMLFLSRSMADNFTKKFPDIEINNGKYKLFTFHPQDRDILSAGFRTDNCFVPGGMADNFGSDDSLLVYSALTPYGGGIEIRNDKGETIAFTPVYRNGNVLMALSVEGVDLIQAEKDIVNNMLSDWANKVIDITNKQEQNGIIAVVSASKANVSEKYYKNLLPEDKMFHIFGNTKSESAEPYLKGSQCIIALKGGCSVDDITYDVPVDTNYEYDINGYLNNYNIVSLTGIELNYIKSMLDLETKIKEYTDMRIKMLKYHQDVVAMEMLRKIKEMRGEFLQKYQELLALDSRALDKYSSYLDALDVINSIKKNDDFFDTNNLVNIYFTDTWFIAEDSKGVWHGNTKFENIQYDALIADLGIDLNKNGGSR